jgi:hypothetical protein
MNISNANKRNANKISATPAQLNGSTLSAKNPNSKQITPNTPGKIAPGAELDEDPQRAKRQQ